MSFGDLKHPKRGSQASSHQPSLSVPRNVWPFSAHYSPPTLPHRLQNQHRWRTGHYVSLQHLSYIMGAPQGQSPKLSICTSETYWEATRLPSKTWELRKTRTHRYQNYKTLEDKQWKLSLSEQVCLRTQNSLWSEITSALWVVIRHHWSHWNQYVKTVLVTWFHLRISFCRILHLTEHCKFLVNGVANGFLTTSH